MLTGKPTAGQRSGVSTPCRQITQIWRASEACGRRRAAHSLVVLASEITPDMRASILSAMEFRGFGDELNRIQEPLAFLKHLVLHEAAHLVLPDGAGEPECDRWAFERLAGRFT